MLAASLAACVPEFIATPTSACASAGASLVPSPVIATSRPELCSRLISAIFVSGVASARKSSTPDSRAIAAAVSGLSPVIMIVRIPIARRRSKRSLHVGLEDVFEVDHAEDALVRAPATAACRRRARCARRRSARIDAPSPPCSRTQARTASGAPLRIACRRRGRVRSCACTR